MTIEVEFWNQLAFQQKVRTWPPILDDLGIQYEIDSDIQMITIHPGNEIKAIKPNDRCTTIILSSDEELLIFYQYGTINFTM